MTLAEQLLAVCVSILAVLGVLLAFLRLIGVFRDLRDQARKRKAEEFRRQNARGAAVERSVGP